jgi:AraC-like DNA-binding protein
MKSRTSFFNATVLKKDITRFAPVWGLYILFLLVDFLTGARNDQKEILAASLADMMRTMSIVNLIFDRSRLSMPMLDGYSLALFKKIFPVDNDDHISVEPVMHLEQDGLRTLLTMLEKIDDELKSIQPGCQLGALALFLEVLVFLSRKCGLDSARQQARFMIGDALRYMNQHYMEVIKVETLARKAKMSVRSFTRHFPEAVGCSPVEYLIKIRLQHAMDQLINTDLSIGEIAINCGFYDSNYFCKKFRQNFHESPRCFRQKFLAGERI